MGVRLPRNITSISDVTNRAMREFCISCCIANADVDVDVDGPVCG